MSQFALSLKPANAAPFRRAVLGSEQNQLAGRVWKRIVALDAIASTTYHTTINTVVASATQGFLGRDLDEVIASRIGLDAQVGSIEAATANVTLAGIKILRNLDALTLRKLEVYIDALLYQSQGFVSTAP